MGSGIDVIVEGQSREAAPVTRSVRRATFLIFEFHLVLGDSIQEGIFGVSFTG